MTKIMLFIGMPVFNGGQYITEAIESIRKQNFEDWEMLISDNCSTDRTEEICERFASIDKRIKYFRQKKNIGAANNFKFLLSKADKKFFMWAACDDIWLPGFISSCINLLEKDITKGYAFSEIVNIDSYGRVSREYPSFRRFTIGSSFRNVINFLWEFGNMGKANLIYGIYRLKSCRVAWQAYPLTNHWGSDMVFVLSVLSRTKFAIVPIVLFQKRVVRKGIDEPERVHKIIIDMKQPSFYPPLVHARQLVKSQLNAVKGTKFFGITLVISLAQLIKLYFLHYFVWRDIFFNSLSRIKITQIFRKRSIYGVTLWK